MKTLFQLIRWDLTLQLRYNIVTIAVIIAALYILLLKLLPEGNINSLRMILLLSDPTMFGILFTGVLVLYEKDNNTLNALVVTPLKSITYLCSKAISLTLIALPITLVIASFGNDLHLNLFYLLLSVTLSSILFVFLGFIVVSRSSGFNQFIIKFALFTLPVSIPVLGLLDIFHLDLYYLIPTQATILLLKAGFGYSIKFWQLIYSIIYLIIWILLSLYLASEAYKKNLLNGKNYE